MVAVVAVADFLVAVGGWFYQLLLSRVFGFIY